MDIDSRSASQNQKLYEHARTRIPGGTQLLSKRPELYAPGQWPPYFRDARGCEVWDLDGRPYIDMSNCGVGACLLGYAHPGVSQAVIDRVARGSACSLNPQEEVALADELCRIHPWADQVRFARGGGEACAIAVRIARATTGRSLVAISGYHGWQDWYLAANLGENDALDGHLLPGLAPAGVPLELRGTALTFPYGNREALQAIINAHGDRLAAVIMEPCRYTLPQPGYLDWVRDTAHRAGALLLLDEITIGFRLHFGGAHLKLGVTPDIAIFAKALGNGHPISAIIGTSEAMEGAHHSFISSTCWTESVGPVAALATLQAMRETDVCAHVVRVGMAVQTQWRASAKKHSVPVDVPDGLPCLAHFAFKHFSAAALRAFYTQLMLERGFLAATAIYPMLAHTESHIDRYAAAIDAVFAEISQTLADDTLDQRLLGPPAQEGFRRLL